LPAAREQYAPWEKEELVDRRNKRDLVAGDSESLEAGALTRRSFMVRAGGAGVALSFTGVLSACGGSSGKSARTVVYADSGGTTRDACRAAFFDPFEKETGIRVVSADQDYAKFALMSERKRSQWDAAEFGASDTIDLDNRDLLAEYPAGTRASDLVPDEYQHLNTGVFWASMNLAYLPDAFGGAQPSTWEDFWNVKKFPGRRAMRRDATWVVEAALLADGVPADQVQPFDFDRAFAKLDEIRPHTTFVESGAEVQQLLQNGDVPMAQLACGRAYALLQEGVELSLSWEQALHYGWIGPTMPHGAPHADEMVMLAEFMTDPRRQAEFARIVGYGPCNPAALEFVDDSMLSQLPTTPEHMEQGFQYDFAEAARQQTEYSRRMAEWLANG
jgi:putative spermidine/putrescine transport system substrate-binding protein